MPTGVYRSRGHNGVEQRRGEAGASVPVACCEIVTLDLFRRWNLELDGPELHTATSRLIPVLREGAPAMLKLSSVEEERRGMRQMAWWDGGGAARVWGHEEGALLMERAEDPRGLGPRVAQGDDAAATRILCEVAERLHAPRSADPPPLEPLGRRFRALRERALVTAPVADDAFFAHAWRVAADLLASPRDIVPLHGDLHHGNVLDFGGGTWRAIDPKGVSGERTFDFANIFCNPSASVATTSGRVEALADAIARHASVDRDRLLAWVVAWCGLSAAWTEDDGGDPTSTLAIGRTAHTLLRP